MQKAFAEMPEVWFYWNNRYGLHIKPAANVADTNKWDGEDEDDIKVNIFKILLRISS